MMRCTPPRFGLLLLATSSMLGACAPAAVDNPSWAADIKPILAANCVRCHGFPSIGGAPDYFRLDLYDDTRSDDGILIPGAGSMASAFELFVGGGLMPPRFPLDGHQIETLLNWAALTPCDSSQAPKGAPRPGNRPPSLALMAPPQRETDGVLRTRYELRDPDAELVYGEFLVGRDEATALVVQRNLHAGRGDLVIDSGLIEAGTHTLFARLDDGSTSELVDLGPLTVQHPGNVAPVIRILAPVHREQLFDEDTPFTVRVQVLDGNPLDVLTMTITATAPNQTEIVVATAVSDARGINELPWDTTDVPTAANWTLTVEVTDGPATSTATSAPFRIVDLKPPPVDPCSTARPR